MNASSKDSFIAHESNGGLYAPSELPKRCGKHHGKKHARAGMHGGENMLSVEIRFVVQGKEVSLYSFVEAIVREVRASVREEISRTFPKREQQGSDFPRR